MVGGRPGDKLRRIADKLGFRGVDSDKQREIHQVRMLNGNNPPGLAGRRPAKRQAVAKNSRIRRRRLFFLQKALRPLQNP